MYNKLKGSNQAGGIRIAIVLLIFFCLASVGCSPQVVNSPEEIVAPTLPPPQPATPQMPPPPLVTLPSAPADQAGATATPNSN